jgi:uncharacterized membrane protein
VLLASIWRAFADRGPRSPRPAAWRVFLISAVVLFGLSFAFSQYWQSQIRGLMDITDYNVPLAVASPLIAAVFFGLLLLVGRGLRGVYRWTVRQLDRGIGRRAATALGWILVVALTFLVITGVLLDGLVSVADKAFSVRDTMTEDGVNQPSSTLRSGGPGSVVSWDSLGRQGRKFTGKGPTALDIQKVVGVPALEPIRAYAGLATAADTEERATKAVDDLDRAGGFQRANLVVFTTTGSGWVDPAMIDSFEYLSGGDSAAVAIQYSYLPSWISYLVDQTKAREAGRTLFDVVYDRWSRLPQDQRPKLYVAGESLGSFGGETAFSGEADLRNRTAGTLFAGPPNFNTLFREFSDNRDAGSPEIQPVFKNGRTVRFASDAAAAIPPTGQAWDGTRVLYLMHPSDPIVWWGPHLILSEPDWIGEAPGQDVLEGMVWLPFVTFWQVSADLAFSTGVPGGHGHKYTTEQVDGWYAVMQGAGQDTAVLDRVKQVIAHDDD